MNKDAEDNDTGRLEKGSGDYKATLVIEIIAETIEISVVGDVAVVGVGIAVVTFLLLWGWC